MKKILVLVLAFIMILSVMPVAFAERAVYSPEVDLYIKNFHIAICFYQRMIPFETDEQADKAAEILHKAEEKCKEEYGYERIGGFDYAYLNDSANSELLEGAAYYNKAYSSAFNEIDEKIKNGELVPFLDYTKYLSVYITIESFYSQNDIEELMEACESYNSDSFIAYKKLCDSDSYGLDLETCTQAEFDAYVDKFIFYQNLMLNCLDGVHNYGEYISNNDATEEANGTKTATCEFCGATDTVIDEGSKLVKEEENLSFFAKLIAWIKALFEKIFSIF